MKRHLATLLLIICILCSFRNACAENVQYIHLKDGSLIHGKIIQMVNGTYTIETEQFGTVTLNEEEITQISDEPKTQKSPEIPDQRNNQNSLNIEGMQKLMLSNPDVMAEVQNLLQDEEIMQVFTDEKFLNDIMSNDLNRIEQNSRMQELLTNPKMMRLIELLSAQQFDPLAQ